VKIDLGGASDDRKLTGLGYFGPSDKVSDWIADRLMESPTCISLRGVDYCYALLRMRPLLNS
jgi:hypothetical protein